MRRTILGAYLFFVLARPAVAQLKAFPTAEGFGANAKGGRGGRAIEVTNLNDSGPGSFRACAEATGARTCIFRVGGTIALSKAISVQEANSYLTIAGQTAPGGGILLKNWGINISYGAHDVIVRHIRIRQGTDHSPQDINNDCMGITVYGPSSYANLTSDIIIDHTSIAWACDDMVVVYGLKTRNVTFQWSLIGEGLTSKDYVKLNGEGANSKFGGSGGGAGSTTFHHNLILHASSRNPLCKGATGSSLSELVDWRNNLVYNWNACHSNIYIGEYHEYGALGNDASMLANFVGNKYIPGPNSNLGCVFGRLGGKRTKVFIQDNIDPFCKSGCSTLADMGFYAQDPNTTSHTGTPPASDSQFRSFSAFAAPAITMTPASSLEGVLTPLTGAGATKPRRDSLDERLLTELASRTGDSGRNGAPWPIIANGTPYADADKDGMRDDWEVARGLNPNYAADGAVKSLINDYTNLENFLNELAGDPIPGSSSAPPPPPPPASPPAPASVAFAAPTQGQHVIAPGIVAAGAPRVDLPITIKTANAVKVELSRDAANPDCPTCGAAFYTWNAPTSGTDTYSLTMCANCFNLAETLPRTMVLHAVAYDSAGNKRQTDVAVLVTNQSTDINGDGKTDVGDVQIAVNQALGKAACGGGDVNKDGACSVADVQLVVNRSLGNL